MRPSKTGIPVTRFLKPSSSTTRLDQPSCMIGASAVGRNGANTKRRAHSTSSVAAVRTSTVPTRGSDGTEREGTAAMKAVLLLSLSFRVVLLFVLAITFFGVMLLWRTVGDMPPADGNRVVGCASVVVALSSTAGPKLPPVSALRFPLLLTLLLAGNARPVASAGVVAVLK